MHLFRENDRSRELYVIQSGSVKVYRTAGGKEIELAILEKGAVLGEMALIDGKPRSASVKALEDCKVIIIDAETFHNKMKGIPPWFFSIIRSTCQKIRQGNRRLQSISSEHQGAHIIMMLNLFYKRFGTMGKGISTATLQHHLIQLLGVTFANITNTLDFLYTHHFIELKNGTLYVIAAEKLDEYCDYLRFLVRKHFDKMDMHDTKLQELAISLATLYPAILHNEEGSTTVDGEHFYHILESSNCLESYLDFIDTLQANGYCGVIRKLKSQGKDPLGDSSIKLHHLSWKRAFLFYTYYKLDLSCL
jgi:CRP/FNR family transcriptional regulator, cyclic AMP receptor protein